MTIVLSVLLFIGFPALIAWIVSGAIDKLLPDWSRRRQAVCAALAAGFIPMALPLVAVTIGDTPNNGESRIIPQIAIVFMALLISLVIGLPVALRTARRTKADAPQPDVFE